MRWEYKFLHLSFVGENCIDDNERALNRLGAEGWEAVAINLDRALLKRPVGRTSLLHKGAGR